MTCVKSAALRAAWASFAFCLPAASGFAQEAVPATVVAQTGAPGAPPAPTTPLAPSTTTGDSARGAARSLGNTAEPSKPVGKTLVDLGVTLTANYTGEAAANPSGGIRQGADYAGQLYLGADFDMQKLVGISGNAVHFAITDRHGSSLAAQDIGNNTSVQEIYGTQNLHLAILTVEQKLLDGHLDFEAGRTTANIAFLNSPIYCNFQTNSACGNPTFIFKDSNFSYFPDSSWGGHVKLWFDDRVYLHVGAYEVNPTDRLLRNNGFTFGTATASGVTVPYELGYGTTFDNDRLPRHYQIGGWFDDSSYADPFTDVNGRPQVLTGAASATDHGRAGLFARFDQMIWRPDNAKQRGLTLFGVAMTNTEGHVTEKQYYELGLLQTGTFPGRDLDTLGFLINDQEFSNLALERIELASGRTNIPRREVMMELAYGVQVNNAIRISPNLQYIINPDQQAEPSRPENIPDAFVIGVKFTVDFLSL